MSRGATNVFCDGLRYIQDNLKEYHVSCFVCVPLLIEAIYKKIMHNLLYTHIPGVLVYVRRLQQLRFKESISIEEGGMQDGT